ncbi:phage tail protein [Bacillus mobilis]|uniref:phage tail protein n=1 Tax=Bacillus mobilis TaxID=2026190 RepID=UPI002E22CBBA|nr:phage tail protein [Bacillus mobilis]MED0957881.1 phage tail protein [Bacillus mobilis]
MLVVQGLNGQSEMLTDYKEVKRKRRVNGEHSLSFYLLNTPNVAHAYNLVDERAIIQDKFGDEYVILGVNKRGHYGKSVIAVHIFFDNMMDWQYNLYNGYANFKQCMDFIFNGTGWKYINQGAFATIKFENFGDDTRSSLLQKALNRYGAEMQIDNKTKTITLKNQIGVETDAQFRYGHNLKTFEEDTDMANFATYIRGYGKDETDKEFMVEYESPMAKVYGKIHQKPIRDERYKTKETLLEACKQAINDVPDTRFKISIANLIENGLSPLHKFNYGDYVYMFYEKADVKLKIRVIDIEDDPTDQTKSPILELSTFKELKTMSAIQAQFQQTQKQVQQLLDDSGNLNLALKRLYMNTQVFQDHTGIWMVDPDNPNRYAHHGAGGSDYHGGMIRIERPDGYATINNGMANFDFSVDEANPPPLGQGVIQDGSWWRTKETEIRDIQYFSFRHEARYFKLSLGSGAEVYGGGMIYITDNDRNILVEHKITNTVEGEEAKIGYTLTVDLGVPTGKEMSLYLRAKAGLPGTEAGKSIFVRRIRKWLEG